MTGGYFFRKWELKSLYILTKNDVTTYNRHQNFDYTTIADRIRTVSWSNDSHPVGVVKPVYMIKTFPLTTKAV